MTSIWREEEREEEEGGTEGETTIPKTVTTSSFRLLDWAVFSVTIAFSTYFCLDKARPANERATTSSVFTEKGPACSIWTDEFGGSPRWPMVSPRLQSLIIFWHISLISASLHRTEVVACQLQPTVRINSGDRNAIFSLSRHFCRRLRYHWNRITRLPGRLGILPFEYQTICGKKYRFESVFYIFIFDWNVCQKLCCCKAVVSTPDVLGNLPV